MEAIERTAGQLVENLHELGLPSMAVALETLESTYHSERFPILDGLELLAELMDAEYQTKVTTRITNRLKRAHLLGCSQDIWPKRLESLPVGHMREVSRGNGCSERQ